MVYKVIGLMSGSSLDGLDIAFVQLEDIRGVWSFEIIAAECIDYDATWTQALKNAHTIPVPEFLKLHTAYGHYLGQQINEFIGRNALDHKVHFIASHGHTVYHNPAEKTTFQIGDGAAMAAITGLPVINDLRAIDVALGGQGAPIVPIGDQLLFGNYHFWLNLGGIANITLKAGDAYTAFDICACNQVLDTLAQRLGKSFDDSGAIAAGGTLIPELLEKLNALPYYQLVAPKSLSNEFSIHEILPLLNGNYATEDLLHTAVVHIAQQIALAVLPYRNELPQMLLATGGGALNRFLIQQLSIELDNANISVMVPEPQIIHYKEALVMALIGTLRWREEVNVLASVTGAKYDNIGGALWLGQAFPVA